MTASPTTRRMRRHGLQFPFDANLVCFEVVGTGRARRRVKRQQRVRVLAAFRCRFRIRALTPTIVPNLDRSLLPGQTLLVPIKAVDLASGKNCTDAQRSRAYG